LKVFLWNFVVSRTLITFKNSRNAIEAASAKAAEVVSTETASGVEGTVFIAIR
jgi:hypothetical protein